MPPKKDTKAPPPPPPQEKKQPQVVIPPEELAGRGRFQFQSGNYYEGEWKLINGKKLRDGQGYMFITFPSSSYRETYKGFWKNDKQDGDGQYHYISGAVYKGQWKNGKHNGYGVMHFPNGDIYEGEWKDQLMHGQGQLYDHKGNLTSGCWSQGFYRSKDQQNLKIQQGILKKKQKISHQSLKFFERFVAAFAKSDKKTFKENLLPFFSADQLKNYYKQPYLKFQAMPPQKWNDLIVFAKQRILTINVVYTQKPLFLQLQRITAVQLNGSGQAIQLICGKQGQRVVKIGLIGLQNEQNFVMVYYNDSAQPEVKKK